MRYAAPAYLMISNSSGDRATRSPTPAATITTCTMSAACCPSTPHRERRQPCARALLIVLMAPAPGVKLITTHAASSESHTVQVTSTA